MSELKLIQRRERRKHPNRTERLIRSGNKAIEATVFLPDKPDEAKRVYVQANGLTTNRYSMELPAYRATEYGDIAFTFNYSSNKLSPGAIARNVADCAAVVNAARAEYDLTISMVGLSMGGEVVLKTAAREDVQDSLMAANGIRPTVTAVAAAGLTKEGIPIVEGAKRVVAGFLPETGRLLIDHKAKTLFVAQACGVHTLRRSLGVLGEIRDLTGAENARNDVVLAHESESMPYLRTYNGIRDSLVPFRFQQVGVQDLPFDRRESYDGGHCDIAFKSEISDFIYMADRLLDVSVTYDQEQIAA
jgi:hypothetical protein